MRTERPRPRLRWQSLSWRIGGLFCLATCGAILALLLFWQHHRTTDVASMNLAGSQRMRAVELGEWAGMVLAGQDADRAGLRARVREFDRALDALEHGGVIDGLQVQRVPRTLARQLADERSTWIAVRSRLLAVADRPRSSTQFQAAGRLVRADCAQMRNRCDALTKAYQANLVARRVRMLRALATVATLNLALLVVGLWYLRRSFLRPLASIGAGLRRLGEGDLTVRLGDLGPATIELQELGRALDETARRIEALQGSALVLQRAVECSAHAVMITDSEGRIEYVNPQFCKTTGYASEEVRGRTPSILKSGGTSHDEYRQLWETVLAGRIWRGSFRNKKKDGALYWESATISPVKDVNGACTHFVQVAEDVTERREIEDRLRLFRALIDRSTDTIQVLDPATGRILDVNRVGWSEHGCTREEYLELNVFDLDPTTDPAWFDAAVASLRVTGSLTRSATHQRRDGALRRMEVNISLVPGAQEYLIAVARDVTEREAARVALERERARLEAVLEHMPLGVAFLFADGRIDFVNPAARRILGASSLPGDPLPRALDRGEATVGEEIREKFPAGVRDLRVWYTPISSPDGKPAGAVSLFEDIGEEVAARRESQQTRKLESLGLLAGGIAHDFNNILTSIQCYCSLLADQLPPQGQARSDLTEIDNAARHAAVLTENLLAFGRKQVLRPRVIDLGKTLERSLITWRRIIEESIEFGLWADPALWRVTIDPVQLDQILINIITNARDAMNREGRIWIEARNLHEGADELEGPGAAPAGDHVMLRIRDSGVGMDEQTRERIFDPFFTTKGLGRGTGLGLCTVHGIVSQSGGRIRVDSVLGEGTSFEILLPRATDQVAQAPVESAASSGCAGTGTVLVVEDDLSVLAVTQRTLEAAGYRVFCAGLPRDGIRLSEDCPDQIDLLLSDVVMPQMNGPSMAACIRERRPGIRVLYMSGYAPDSANLADELGAGAHFLGKPISPDDLLQAVREALRSEPPSDALRV